MSKDIKKILNEALLNNSFDNDALNFSLKNTLYNSYSFLQTFQQAEIPYEYLCYYSGGGEQPEGSKTLEFYIKDYKVAIDLDYNIVVNLDRELYRHSKFYNKEFTITDILYNPDIFSKIPIVIIDDCVVWNYKLQIINDMCSLIFQYDKSFILNIKDYDEEEGRYKPIPHKIQILIVESKYYFNQVITKAFLNLDDLTKSFKIKKSDINTTTNSIMTQYTNDEFCKKYGVTSINKLTTQARKKYDNIINHRVSITKLPDTASGVLFISLNPTSEKSSIGTGLLWVSNEDDDYLYVQVNDEVYNSVKSIASTTKFCINCIYIDKLHHHDFYDGNIFNIVDENGNSKYACIEESKNSPYNCPIPTSNFMVFKRQINGDKFNIIDSIDNLTQYYPNIYQITDKDKSTGNEYNMFYFYYPVNELKFSVMFDFYFSFIFNKFTDKSIEEIVNRVFYDTDQFLSEYTDDEKEKFISILQKIIDYKDYHYLYNENDFIERYKKTAGNEDKDAFEYRVETYREWIKHNSDSLRKYVLNQNKLGASYHLFTNQLKLEDRIRTDTSKELGDETYKVFDEPMYVFGFPNKYENDHLLDLRVFVDGIFATDMQHYRHNFMDYFYIPVRTVTNDSYIELEVFPGYQYHKELTFNSMDDEYQITLAETNYDIFPTYADIFFQDTESVHKYDKSLFDMSVVERTSDILIDRYSGFGNDVKFTRLKTFKIKPNHKNALGHILDFRINKTGDVYPFTVETSGFLLVKFVGNETTHYITNECLRIFDKDGRLIPRVNYRVVTFAENPYVIFFDDYKAGDKFYFDITPYSYKHVYYQKEITEKNPIIDLSNFLTKPFDIRYYDVYLNGRKLSINNVITVSPYEITLVNIDTIYHLDIYERERDWEYFGTKYKDQEYVYFAFDDLYNSEILKDKDKQELLKSIIDKERDKQLNIRPNTNTEEPIDHEQGEIDVYVWSIHEYYFDQLIPYTYTNPDTIQESSGFMEFVYEELYDHFKRFPINDVDDDYSKSLRESMIGCFFLDPDDIIDGECDHETMAVYSVGHLDELSDEILSQTVEMNNTGDIDS